MDHLDQRTEDQTRATTRAAGRAGMLAALAVVVLWGAGLVLIAWTVLDPYTAELGWSDLQRTIAGIAIAMVGIVPAIMAAGGPVASTVIRWHLNHNN